MSTIAEIERAIEQLPAAQVTALAAWLEEYRANLDSADPVQPVPKKSFMKLAGSLEGPADLSQRKGFSATWRYCRYRLPRRILESQGSIPFVGLGSGSGS